jgi:DNA-binding transcriptional ArsR family regulator
MRMDGFTLIADPTRRRILDLLRQGECDVSELVSRLEIPQPLVSKHLRTLRDSGTVVAQVAGARRIYRLAMDPLPEVLAWVEPYHQMWSTSLNRLAHIIEEENRHD